MLHSGLISDADNNSERNGLILSNEGQDCNDEETHALYRTCTEMLLYCIKHSRPEISNVVKRTKQMSIKANEAAYYKECCES
jgi:hypothetical protein